jgi:hypothetical protein
MRLSGGQEREERQEEIEIEDAYCIQMISPFRLCFSFFRNPYVDSPTFSFEVT